jgi:hypothetical protein
VSPVFESAKRGELRVRPERRQIDAVGLELLEHVEIPFEVELTHPVVGDGERFRARVGGEIEIVALHGDELLAVGLDDTERDIEPLGLLDGLVDGDDATEPIDQDRAAGTVLA